MEQITAFITESTGLAALIAFAGLVTLIILFTTFAILRMVAALMKFDALSKGQEYEPLFSSLWKSIDKQLTNAVPIEKEKEVALHNYDGIVELDNHMPPWWLAMFYLGIVFGVVYMLRYHVLETAPLSKEEFELEMAQAKADVEAYRLTMANSIDETNVVMLEETSDLTEGAVIYKANCVTCHGAEAEGLVGPNLTDKYWLHGGSIQDVFKSVKYGIPDKGMRAWQEMLSPQQMAQVTSYIMTLQGSEPANPKDPQGEEYIPKATE